MLNWNALLGYKMNCTVRPTQCWDWVHYASSNWCQLSAMITTQCWNWMHYTKQICFNMINSLNQLHFTSSNIDSKQMAESSQSQHLEGWNVNPSPSPCWKACSSSPCNASSSHGKFKPANRLKIGKIFCEVPPKNPYLYSSYYPLVKILQKCGTKWNSVRALPLNAKFQLATSSKRETIHEIPQTMNSQFILAPSEHSSKCGTKWTRYCSRAQVEPKK
jgi:hypothetical protein